MLMMCTAGSYENHNVPEPQLTARFPGILNVALLEASEEWWRATHSLWRHHWWAARRRNIRKVPERGQAV